MPWIVTSRATSRRRTTHEPPSRLTCYLGPGHVGSISCRDGSQVSLAEGINARSPRVFPEFVAKLYRELSS